MSAIFHSHLQHLHRARMRLRAALDEKNKHIDELASELHSHRMQLFRLETSYDRIIYSSRASFHNSDQ
jgi:hypothetical protein